MYELHVRLRLICDSPPTKALGATLPPQDLNPIASHRGEAQSNGLVRLPGNGRNDRPNVRQLPVSYQDR
jgi:hypothetical protein